MAGGKDLLEARALSLARLAALDKLACERCDFPLADHKLVGGLLIRDSGEGGRCVRRPGQ